MNVSYFVIEIIVAAIVVFGCVYHLCTWWCVSRQFTRATSDNLPPRFTPPVSILKPLKGASPGLMENLESFCRQDYPDYELVFGTADPNDPAVAVVRGIEQAHPDLKVRLVVSSGPGMNPKSALLDALTREARNPVLAISDSDIRVKPDYLRRVTAPLDDPRTGVVTCLYTTEPLRGTPTEVLDALHVSLRFLPSVALAARLPGVRLGFGATLAARRDDLERAGGYRSIADYLADDSMLSAILEERGLKVRLADFTVEHRPAQGSLRGLWRREVRWARTARVIGPLSYAGVVLTFPLVWSCVLLALASSAVWAWVIAAVALAVRCGTAWCIAGVIKTPRLRRHLVWLPLRDLADVAVWIAAFTGSRVTWRGATYKLLRDGRLATDSPTRFEAFRRCVRTLDVFLRKRQRIFEYSGDPACLFRIAICRARKMTILKDGTSIASGERYIELHLWNEHLPKPRAQGSTDLAWGRVAQRQIEASLRQLAAYIRSKPRLRPVRALHARTAFATRSSEQLARMVRRLGFEFHGRMPAGGLFARLHGYGEDLLVWALSWAFNPTDRKRGVLSRPRHALWMSKQALLDRYGTPARTSGRRKRGQPRYPEQVDRDSRAPSRPVHGKAQPRARR